MTVIISYFAESGEYVTPLRNMPKANKYQNMTPRRIVKATAPVKPMKEKYPTNFPSLNWVLCAIKALLPPGSLSTFTAVF